jgi:AcrR family transcriptional regulator
MTTASALKTAAQLLGDPDAARNARDRLIDKAIDLFYRHGFNAIGLDRIIDEVGVTKTTFYKYFHSKDDLMVAAVRKRDEWEMKAWLRAVREGAGDDPRAQLLAFFDVMDVWFNAPDFRGCMFINTAAEFPNPHDPIH